MLVYILKFYIEFEINLNEIFFMFLKVIMVCFFVLNLMFFILLFLECCLDWKYIVSFDFVVLFGNLEINICECFMFIFVDIMECLKIFWY